MAYRWYGFRRWLSDICVWIDLYRRCEAAFAEGAKARLYYQYMDCGPTAVKFAEENFKFKTYCEGTQEHEAWIMGKNGEKGFYISDDFQAKVLR